MHLRPLKTGDFDYKLDASLIAQHPCQRRDASRLMVLDRSSGRREHRVFSDLPELLRSGDLLVLNDTRVIPAKFVCRRSGGGRVEGLFCRQIEAGRWEVLLKNASRCRPGQTLAFDRSDRFTLRLAEALGQGRWLVTVLPAEPAEVVLEAVGSTPLPHYIRRGGEREEEADRLRYQTVYASRAGAVAAPTAGLHFTEELLAKLEQRGVRTAWLTLHVGTGTFLPVTEENPRRHKMHPEWYGLPADTAGELNAARREGRRVVAVGTTSLRVLETLGVPAAVYRGGGQFRPTSGWTDLFILPPAEFRAVDAMVTNFHLPRSTLLMLVAAFCQPGGTDGLKMVLDAYAEAAKMRYRFYSYGDAMLIL